MTKYARPRARTSQTIRCESNEWFDNVECLGTVERGRVQYNEGMRSYSYFVIGFLFAYCGSLQYIQKLRE